MKAYELFGTQACHLCELAEQVLAPLVTDNIQIELIDIAEEAQYFDTYALRIPVLRSTQTGEELGWPFTPEQAQAFLVDN